MSLARNVPIKRDLPQKTCFAKIWLRMLCENPRSSHFVHASITQLSCDWKKNTPHHGFVFMGGWKYMHLSWGCVRVKAYLYRITLLTVVTETVLCSVYYTQLKYLHCGEVLAENIFIGVFDVIVFFLWAPPAMFYFVRGHRLQDHTRRVLTIWCFKCDRKYSCKVGGVKSSA